VKIAVFFIPMATDILGVNEVSKFPPPSAYLLQKIRSIPRFPKASLELDCRVRSSTR